MGFLVGLLKTTAVGAPIAGLFILFVGRVIPDEKMYNFFFGLGMLITTRMRGWLGKAFWEKIEEQLFKKSLSLMVGGLQDGVDSDDEGSKKRVFEKKKK